MKLSLIVTVAGMTVASMAVAADSMWPGHWECRDTRSNEDFNITVKRDGSVTPASIQVISATEDGDGGFDIKYKKSNVVSKASCSNENSG